MQIHYPYRIDGRGRTGETSEDAHVRQMIEQVLFTAPGERVNRPEFGSRLPQLLFAPNSPELGAATEFLVRGALQQWLGEVIEVSAVEVETDESTLQVLVRYRLRRTQEEQVARFTREV